MNRLSVVIPFLNEGEEVENTIKSILCTADCPVDIVMVNDASDDSFDYKRIADKYSATYIRHAKRLGSGPAKQSGINACRTPYFLVIDAHMRFYDNNWCRSIINAIETDERAVYCCCCKVWNYSTKSESSQNKMYYAARIEFLQQEKRNIIEPVWIKNDIWGGENLIVDVPCLLGACYASTKYYWNYLKGYEGLQFYGCEEAYISMKAWMEGGRCRLIKYIGIGHLFKDDFFFTTDRNELFYNKMLIIKTLFPEQYQRKYIRALKAMSYVDYIRAKEQFDSNISQITSLKEYYNNILTVPFETIMELNEEVERKINDQLLDLL